MIFKRWDIMDMCQQGIAAECMGNNINVPYMAAVYPGRMYSICL